MLTPAPPTLTDAELLRRAADQRMAVADVLERAGDRSAAARAVLDAETLHHWAKVAESHGGRCPWQPVVSHAREVLAATETPTTTARPPVAPTAPNTWERVDSYGDAIRAHQRDNGLIDVWNTADACTAEFPGGQCQRREGHGGDCSPEPNSLDVLVLTPREARELAAWLLARTEGGGS